MSNHFRTSTAVPAVSQQSSHDFHCQETENECTRGLSPCALLGFTDDAETDTRQTNKLADAATEFFRST